MRLYNGRLGYGYPSYLSNRRNGFEYRIVRKLGCSLVVKQVPVKHLTEVRFFTSQLIWGGSSVVERVPEKDCVASSTLALPAFIALWCNGSITGFELVGLRSNRRGATGGRSLM